MDSYGAPKIWLAGLTAMFCTGAFAVQASAQADGQGSFSCRASAVRVFTAIPPRLLEPHVANAMASPCRTSSSSRASWVVPGVASVGLLEAKTNADPDGLPGGEANASVANAVITVGATRIEVGLLEASAHSYCTSAAQPALTGTSSVARLRINGAPRTVSGSTTIPVGPLTLHLNRRIVADGVATYRALELSAAEAAGPAHLVVGEASAGVERCVQRQPTAAHLAIKTPQNCFQFPDEFFSCSAAEPRTLWRTLTNGMAFACDAGQPPGTDFDTCPNTIAYRGTGTTGDILSWTLDFGDGTSAGGSWTTNPPSEVTHLYPHPFTDVWTVTLTVIDSQGQTSTDSLFWRWDTPD
jgi:hypothetical protein